MQDRGTMESQNTAKPVHPAHDQSTPIQHQSPAAILQANPHLTSIAVGAFIFRPAPAPPSSAGTPEEAAPMAAAQILLIRRAATEPAFPGCWEVPGGGCELGADGDSTLAAAVTREVREETGLAVTRVGDLVNYVEFSGRDGRRWRKYSFLCHVPETEGGDGGRVVLDPVEHDDYRWCTHEEVLLGKGAGGLAMSSDEVRTAIARAFCGRV